MAITVDPEPVWDQPIDVPEKWIETVDENVAASKCMRTAGSFFWTDGTRASGRLSGQRNSSLRRKLLDTHRGTPDGTIRWNTTIVLPEGTLHLYSDLMFAETE